MASEAHDLEPAFQANYSDNIVEQPPIPKLPIVAFALGLFSLVVLLAPTLLPVSVLAIVVGVLAAITGNGKSWLTTVGVGLGILTAVWSTVSVSKKNDYYFREAGKAAEHFLDLLSSGKQYEAIELSHMEMDRQITGTDLEKYYASLKDEERDIFEEFIHDPLNIAVMNSGPDAEWKYVKGIRIRNVQGSSEIVVECQDKKNASSPIIWVRLQRSLNLMVGDDSVALWNILDVVAPGEL